MNNDRFVLDTTGQAFFESELKYVAERTYDRVYPRLTARTLFPVASNFAPWASDVAFRSYERFGAAKIMADSAIDMPLVDVAGAEQSYPARTVGMGFNYSDLELIRAQRTGVRLDEKRSFAAREAIETEINRIAFNGDSDFNLPGLFDNSDIGSADATTGGWVSTATAAQIVADLQALYAAYFAQNNGEEIPNTLALAPAPYARIAVTAMGTYDTRTILGWLQAGGLPGVNNVIMCPDCHSVAAFTSDDVGILYTRDSSKLELKLPAEVKIFAPQATGIGFHIPMYARVSGLHIFYPKSIYVLKNLQG